MPPSAGRGRSALSRNPARAPPLERLRPRHVPAQGPSRPGLARTPGKGSRPPCARWAMTSLCHVSARARGARGKLQVWPRAPVAARIPSQGTERVFSGSGNAARKGLRGRGSTGGKRPPGLLATRSPLPGCSSPRTRSHSSFCFWERPVSPLSLPSVSQHNEPLWNPKLARFFITEQYLISPLTRETSHTICCCLPSLCQNCMCNSLSPGPVQGIVLTVVLGYHRADSSLCLSVLIKAFLRLPHLFRTTLLRMCPDISIPVFHLWDSTQLLNLSNTRCVCFCQ